MKESLKHYIRTGKQMLIKTYANISNHVKFAKAA